jgi:Domain of unknown function (DUF1707)
MGGVDEPLPEVRIGDRERRGVDDHLRQALDDGVLTLTEYDERAALCWAARTRRDLDALIRDLPPYRPDQATQPTPAAPDTASSDEPSRPGFGRRAGRALVAVVLAGAGLYLGGQVITANDGVSVFGKRTVYVAPGQDRVEVGMAFGSIDVVVPDDARARTTGTLLFAGTDCGQACQRPGRDVVVDVTGAFGSVDVLSQAEYAQNVDLDDREDEDDDDD